MYLKSLEISGFKSFGKKTHLGFTSPITGIVGPNGSGKSNVAEAFRFVLGEQSIKSLRGKRAEDLIFNGGKDAVRANRASVKLVFDNSRRIFQTIDFDEVSIERAVNRDSSSEYSINGSQVRLKDVVELLANAHIGSSGHHIISQGEADRILNANSREKREMIEDALGLKIYQYKKQESLRKLEKTSENIEKVESLRRELAPHLRFLKKQVERVEKAIQMKNDLTRLYHIYFNVEERYINEQKKVLQTERHLPQQKMSALETQLMEAKDLLAKSINKDKKSDEIIRLEGEIRETRTRREESGRSVGRIEGEIASLTRLVVREKETLAKSEDVLIPLSLVKKTLSDVDHDLDSAVNESDISKVRVLLASVRDVFKRFLETHHTNTDTSRVTALEEELAVLRKEKISAEDSFRIISEREAVLQDRYTLVQMDIEREKDTSRDAEKAVFRIMAEQNEVRTILSTIAAREEKLRLEEEDFKRELSEAGVLVGIVAVHYKDKDFVNEHGVALSRDIVFSEPRTMQEDRRRVIEKIKIRLEDSGLGGTGEDVMKEFNEASERDVFLARELEDLVKSSASLNQLIADLDLQLVSQFKEGILKINTAFQNFFALMFGGGTASLSVVREKKRRRTDAEELSALGGDSADVELGEGEEETEEGVEIEVNLPRKKVKSLMMLSGGERALTSIALLFAISQVNPPPFIILDETDAALDEANSKKYGDMIESLAKLSQLILITHNRETMSRAGILYGVTMGGDGVSRLLSIAFETAVEVAK